LKPPFHAGTYALWLGPAAILAIGGAAVAFYLRRRRHAKDDALAPLSETEQQRLQALLSEKQQ
jgi:cytochrome c-type biogenesis protein CcmH